MWRTATRPAADLKPPIGRAGAQMIKMVGAAECVESRIDGGGDWNGGGWWEY